MSSKGMKRSFIVMAAFGLIAGGAWWQQRNVVEVDITTFGTENTIKLADAESGRWFAIQPGKNELKKGAYLYSLKNQEREKMGLIAINDATPIVLK